MEHQSAMETTGPYVISSSYGNDSVALLQFAKERQLQNVSVVYCDTGWAHPDWPKRVQQGEALAKSFGFKPYTIRGEFTFETMVRHKKCFPSNKMQFCTGFLKVIPFHDFMDEHDPLKQATVVIGKRRAESQRRANTPEFVPANAYYDGRTVWHPLYKHTDAERNALVERTGMEVLLHRSEECCPCVNANRAGLRATPKSQIDKVRKLEAETGRELFRARSHQGAWGIDEVMEWAHSARGRYVRGQLSLWDIQEDGCESGMCGA